jgi:hypothetical protein
MPFNYYMEEDQKQQLDGLKESLQRHEEGLMEVFINEGPESLRKLLAVESENDWKLIFDYLVKRKNVLERCAVGYMPFFTELVIKNGPKSLRKIFKLEGPEYDQSFKRLMEMVSVSHGAIYRHVLANKAYFAGKILSGDSKNIRSELCIADSKYDVLWSEILGLLQDAVCQNVYDEKICDEGLSALTLFLNTLREQRALIGFGGGQV